MMCRYFIMDKTYDNNLEIVEHIWDVGIMLNYNKCIVRTEFCSFMVTGTL